MVTIYGSTVKPVSPPNPFSETRRENLNVRKKQEREKIIYTGATIANVMFSKIWGEGPEEYSNYYRELFLQK